MFSGRHASHDALDYKNFANKSNYFRLLNKLINMLLFSDKRLRENDISFYDYINPQDKATEDFVLEYVGPIIGMEAKKDTLFSVAKAGEITYMSNSIEKGFKKQELYVANGPYSEVIFNPWAEYLTEMGVNIRLNTTITALNYDLKTNKIVSIDTSNTKNIPADDFIICLDQTAIAKLLTLTGI